MTQDTLAPSRDLPAPAFDYNELGYLMTLMTGDEKHSSSATSTLDVLWVLYDKVMRIDPTRPDDPNRDRFLLSKGHGPMAYYAVLAAKGFIPVDWLSTFGTYESPLGWHPDGVLVPGIEIASGSLGHGLPIAVGAAAALRARSATTARVFCLIGDAEFDEGSNHEAIFLAGALHLERLTAIVIDNGSASHDWQGGIAPRFEIEGWSTATVDGRDHAAIESALTVAHPGRPHCVVALVEDK